MEQFNIYKDGVKVSTTDDTTFDFTDLQSNKRYKLGVSRVVDGRESKVVTVSASTKEHIPYSLHVTDRTDTTVSLKWDSDAEIGEGIYNIYVNEELFEQNIQRREFKVRGLKPATEYKFCLCGVKEDGTETPKVTVTESTLASIDEDEPEVNYPLNNLVIDGSFETYDGVGVPRNWVDVMPIGTYKEVDTDFATDGDQSFKIGVLEQEPKPSGTMAIVQYEMELESGYYVTIIDYNMPEAQEVNGRQKNVFSIAGANSSEYIQVFGGSGTVYVVGKLSSDTRSSVNLYLADYDPSETGGWVSVDSLRMYKIDEEMFNYLDKGKMPIDRIKEVFPYSEVADESLSANVDDYHTGAGWYELPNGEKVRGKDNAIEMLENLLDK